MSLLTTAKQALRNEMKNKVALLSSEQVKQQSELVITKLLSLPEYQRSSRVSVYLSLHSEIQTNDIVKDIFNSGKHCFIPRYSKGSTEMDMVRLYSLEDLNNLPKTKWNIKQPLETEDREDALKTGGLDLVIVPGVAFTLDGKRLGHGKGYYDRFLRRCVDPVPFTVGLALMPQIVPDVPTDDTDVKLNLVLCPQDAR